MLLLTLFAILWYCYIWLIAELLNIMHNGCHSTYQTILLQLPTPAPNECGWYSRTHHTSLSKKGHHHCPLPVEDNNKILTIFSCDICSRISTSLFNTFALISCNRTRWWQPARRLPLVTRVIHLVIHNELPACINGQPFYLLVNRLYSILFSSIQMLVLLDYCCGSPACFNSRSTYTMATDCFTFTYVPSSPSSAKRFSMGSFCA